MKLPTLMIQVTAELPQVTNYDNFTTTQPDLNLPIFVDELRINDLGDNTLPATFEHHTFVKQEPSIKEDYVYNYEFLNYENLTRTIDEKQIPSFNLFNYRKYIGTNTNISNKIYSYDGTLNPGLEMKVSFDIPSKVPKYGYHTFDTVDQSKGTERKNYYDNYFNFWTKYLTEDSIGLGLNGSWTNKQKYIFSYYNPEINFDYLPNFISLNFSLNNTDLPNPLDDEDLMKFLFLHIKRRFTVSKQFTEFDVNNPDLGDQVRDIKVWNVMSWLMSEDLSVLGELEDELILLSKNDKDNRFYRDYLERRLRKVIAIAKMRQIAKTLTPTLKDVLVDNVNCKSLVIGYKIQKRRKDANRTLIQTFYTDQTNFEFIDNQLRYDESYSYEIFELRMVFGSTFTAIDNSDPKVYKAVRVPSIVVTETFFKMYDFKITTPPINSPKIQISNLKLKKNFIRFKIEEDLRNTGKYTPFVLEKVLPVDEARIQELKDAYFIKDDKYRYYGRATTGNFEVFKIDFKPKKYSDFNEGYLGLLQRTPEPTNDLNPVAYYEDLIEHEKKYYYLFRSVDQHLNSGRQSYVCEVMLLQDADEVILRTSQYKLMPIGLPYQNEVKFRKFLQLEPDIQQVLFKDNIDLIDLDTELPDSELNLSKIFLGNEDFDSLWSYNGEHRFIKLRVEGTESGKKVDLNLRFKIKRKI
jgi:hypothetical protein